jgi:hypothetical protein
MPSLGNGIGISQTSGENCMRQVIVTDLFNWIRKPYLPARRLGFWRWLQHSSVALIAVQ